MATFGGRYIVKKAGPLAVFAVIFSFFIPPIGFAMAIAGYFRDKKLNERVVGWIVIMVIACIMSTLYIAMLITYAAGGFPQPAEAETYLLLI